MFCRYGRKREQIAILIASNFVIHPQILIFSVFKIASLPFLRMKRCSRSYRQNHRVYAPRDTRKHSIAAECLLRCRPTFSKSLMVSLAMSELGCSPLFFIEPGVKVDGRYYRDVLLKQQMLTVAHWWHAPYGIAGGTYMFQQDSAPAHYTVQLLQQETPEFIAPDLWKPNSPDLNPVGQLPCLGLMQERVYRTAVRDTADLKQRLIETWLGIPQTVRRNHWRVGATTTSLHQSKGTSLRALALTNRFFFSEPPNATTQQLAVLRASHILSKKAFVCLNISSILLTHKYTQHTQLHS